MQRDFDFEGCADNGPRRLTLPASELTVSKPITAPASLLLPGATHKLGDRHGHEGLLIRLKQGQTLAKYLRALTPDERRAVGGGRRWAAA